MERLEFDCDYDMSDEIEAIIENTNDENYLISVYGKYDVIKIILEKLIADGFSIANEIELEDYDISNYDKEFVLYVTEDGVNVEKTYCNDSYLYSSADISFVHEDCSSTLLKYIQSDRIYEFGYIDEEFDNDSESERKYTVNGQPVSKDEFDEFISRFKETDGKTTELNVNFTGRLSPEESDIILKKVKESFREDIRNMLNSMHHPQSCLHPLEFFY